MEQQMHEQKMSIHGKSENSLGNGEGTVSWIATADQLPQRGQVNAILDLRSLDRHQQCLRTNHTARAVTGNRRFAESLTR